jgi:hypothetical protein
VQCKEGGGKQQAAELPRATCYMVPRLPRLGARNAWQEGGRAEASAEERADPCSTGHGEGRSREAASSSKQQQVQQQAAASPARLAEPR